MIDWDLGDTFFVVICSLGFGSAAASSWVAWQCWEIDACYSVLRVPDATMLRIHVFYMSICNLLYSLHYFKYVALWISKDVYQQGVGKIICIILGVYSETFLVATVSWYFCITGLLLCSFLEWEVMSNKRQIILVCFITILMTFLPLAFSKSQIDTVYGPGPLGELYEVTDCSLLARHELVHDLFLLVCLIFSFSTMLVGLWKLKGIIFGKDVRRDKHFIYKLTMFTFVFLITFIWRPIMKLRGKDDDFVWLFVSHATVAAAGIGNWGVWQYRITTHKRMTTDISILPNGKSGSRLLIQDQFYHNRSQRFSRSIKIFKHRRNNSESTDSLRQPWEITPRADSDSRKQGRFGWATSYNSGPSESDQWKNIAGSSFGTVNSLRSSVQPVDPTSPDSLPVVASPSSDDNSSSHNKQKSIPSPQSEEEQRENTNGSKQSSRHKRCSSVDSDHINTFFGWSYNSQENLLQDAASHRRVASADFGRKRLESKGEINFLDEEFLQGSPGPQTCLGLLEDDAIQVKNGDETTTEEFSPPKTTGLFSAP